MCKLSIISKTSEKQYNQSVFSTVWNENNFILGKAEFMLIQVIYSIYQNIIN